MGRSERAGRWRSKTASFDAAYGAQPPGSAVGRAIPGAVSADMAQQRGLAGGSASSPPTHHSAWGWKEPGRKKDSDNWRAHPPPSAVLGAGAAGSSSLGGAAAAGGSVLSGSLPVHATFADHSALAASAQAIPASSARARLLRTGALFAGSSDFTGPAAPLNPLQIRNDATPLDVRKRPLVHPSNSPRFGGENWALTPTSSLPSLPGTPQRTPGQARPHASTPADGSPVPRAAVSGFGVLSGAPGSSSRELVAARAVLNKRHDETGSSGVPQPPAQAATVPSSPSKAAPATQHGLAPPQARNLAIATGSPKRSPLSLAATSTPMLPPAVPRAGRALQPLSPGPSPRLAHRSISPPADSASNGYIASMLTPSALTTGNVHSLLRRDSVASLASSHGGPGTHSLAHSRRASQIFSSAASAASPSNASIMSGAAPSRRPYRPPHLRNRESGQNLLPGVAHYDRVRTPSLRGISRSPDPSVAASSRAGSRPPSTAPFSPAAVEVAEMARLGLAGRRRLSSLGSFHTLSDVEAMAPPTLHEGREASPEDYFTEHSRASSADRDSAPPDLSSSNADSSLDSRTLMAKLASTWARRSFAPSSNGGDDIAELSAELDDVDLSVEDMMAGPQSLTDGFCISRQASHLTDARPVDIFEVGDRLGPGMMHDGLRIRIAQTSDGFREQPGDTNGKQLEVISKLGEGSYAVVYLVREVDPKPGGASASPEVAAANGVNMTQARAESSSSPPTPSALDDHEIYSRTLRASDVAMGDRTISSVADSSGSLSESDLQPPREFALKCLCKRDLSDEMLEVQRLEATIHQSIPRHPHIVTLYRTYETEDWLFLILEYCPGQDLYYWLEQAHDTENLGSGLSPGYTDSNSDASPGYADSEGDTSATFYIKGDQTVGDLTAGAARDSTPPSPSLLASTAGAALLSRKRLRLVSRMFQQMCDAVQFCHDRGISHRDLKPENFIVEDRREAMADDSADSLDRSRGSAGRPGTATRRSSSFSMTRESMREFESRITVKLTDFGLAVAQDECVDFDCGSKPYMAYECRNNVADWYDPRQADIWSLGVVLLNLLFHRSPFAEPCAEACDSFAAFSYDPVRFLTQAFDGLSVEAAEFLADNVLCDVTNPRSDGSPRRRVTASELGMWAADLPRLLSTKDGQPRPSRGADTDITSPIVYSRTPSSSTLPSLFGSPLAFGPGQHTIHESMELEHDDLPNYPSLFPEYANGEATRDEPRRDRSVGSLSPNVEGTPDILPSPTFSPPTRTLPLSGGSAPRSRAASRVPSTGPEPDVERSAEAVPAVTAAAHASRHSPQSSEDSDVLANATPRDASSPTRETASDADEHGGGASGDTDVPPAHESEAPRPIGHSKRRKRGARKGRNAANKQDKTLLRRSQSAEVLPSADLPAAPLGLASSSVPDPRDDILAQLAQASQDLARDLSRVSKYKTGGAMRSGLSVSQPHTPASFGNTFPRSPIAVPQRTLARYSHEESGAGDEGASYGSQSSREYTSWLDRERPSAAQSVANHRYADQAATTTPVPWKAQLTTAPTSVTNATPAIYTKWDPARRDRVPGTTGTTDTNSMPAWRERSRMLPHADTTPSDPALSSAQHAVARPAAAKASLLSMAHSLSAKKERANIAAGVAVPAAQDHVPAASLMPPPPVQKSGVSRFFSVRSRS